MCIMFRKRYYTRKDKTVYCIRTSTEDVNVVKSPFNGLVWHLGQIREETDVQDKEEIRINTEINAGCFHVFGALRDAKEFLVEFRLITENSNSFIYKATVPAGSHVVSGEIPWWCIGGGLKSLGVSKLRIDKKVED